MFYKNNLEFTTKKVTNTINKQYFADATTTTILEMLKYRHKFQNCWKNLIFKNFLW